MFSKGFFFRVEKIWNCLVENSLKLKFQVNNNTPNIGFSKKVGGVGYTLSGQCRSKIRQHFVQFDLALHCPHKVLKWVEKVFSFYGI